jgi:hypothetical protein
MLRKSLPYVSLLLLTIPSFVFSAYCKLQNGNCISFLTLPRKASEYTSLGNHSSNNELLELRNEIQRLHHQQQNAKNATTIEFDDNNVATNLSARIQSLTNERQQLESQVKRLEREYNLLYSKVDNSTWFDGKIKEFTHFYSHIPKSGGSYACKAIASLVMEDPRWKRLDDGDKFGNCDVSTRQTPMVEHSSLHEELTRSRKEERITAQTEDEGPEYCAPWEVDSDNWWLHHPDWEPSTENETAYCFAPIKDTEKATSLKELHKHQWTGNCSEIERSCEMNSGFGASTGWLQDSFWHASKQSKPFQILLNGRRWLYATANNASWAYCENKDTRCYYLPVSPCSRDFVGNRNQHLTGPRPSRHQDKLRFHWMRHYLYRPKQHLRRKSFEMRQSLNISYPCTKLCMFEGVTLERDSNRFVDLQLCKNIWTRPKLRKETILFC